MTIDERTRNDHEVRLRMAEYRSTHQPRMDTSTREAAAWAWQQLREDNALLAANMAGWRERALAAEREVARQDERLNEALRALVERQEALPRPVWRGLFALRRWLGAWRSEMERQAQQTRWRFPATWR